MAHRLLNTTSEKIRRLAAKGEARADIARKLGIRYQHVNNVLEQDKIRQRKAQEGSGGGRGSSKAVETLRVRLGPEGRVVIPAPFREALGLKEGDVLFARLENGEIQLLTPMAAARRAQAIVRQFVPEGVSLVDELLADRRREVEREQRGG